MDLEAAAALSVCARCEKQRLERQHERIWLVASGNERNMKPKFERTNDSTRTTEFRSFAPNRTNEIRSFDHSTPNRTNEIQTIDRKLSP